jgi:hypothetical protein
MAQSHVRACSFDSFGLTLSCGAWARSGGPFTGPTILSPGPAPAAPTHGWGSYYIELMMEGHPPWVDPTSTGQRLTLYAVGQ